MLSYIKNIYKIYKKKISNYTTFKLVNINRVRDNYVDCMKSNVLFLFFKITLCSTLMIFICLFFLSKD